MATGPEEIEFERGPDPGFIHLAFPMMLIAIVFFLNHFVGPKYIAIFKELRVDLPIPTRTSILISQNAISVSLLLVGILVFFYFCEAENY
jgi:type II secretory pathway component PulF